MATRSCAERVERREDLEALKTHLPSNQNSLEAREETRSVASLPCSAFINGESLGWGWGWGSACCLLCSRCSLASASMRMKSNRIAAARR
jgi:hypothetical protein